MVYVYKFCYRIWTDSEVIRMLDISCITYIMIEVLCICPTQALKYNFIWNIVRSHSLLIIY